jgi:RNA recognition motif-containing protein
LYVGNLPYDASVEEVQLLINTAAPDCVVRVHLPMDTDGRKRGFGFVTMSSSEAAKGAAEALRTADLRGRRLVVNLAHPKGDRPPRADTGHAGGVPFPSGFGGMGANSPPHKKAGHEERRKRSFEDGAGPRKKRVDRDDHRSNRLDYGDDDD